MNRKSNRIIGLDILKVFCIFFVILLHTEILKSVFDINLEPLCRFAVPCFFLITGFFYHTTLEQNKELQQIKKVIVLIVAANSLLLIINIFYCFIHNKSIIKWFVSLFSPEKILNCFVFNVNLVAGHFETAHLWYLNALLYVLLIAAFLRKVGAFKILYYLTPVLLIVGLIVECFSEQIFGVNFKDVYGFYYYRNFLTMGIPYFSIGNLLFIFQDKLKTRKILLFISSIFLLVLSVFEMIIMECFSCSSNGEFFLLTPLCSVCLFLFFLLFFEDKNYSRFWNLISAIGRKYVVWIYILQYPVIVFIKDFLSKYGGEFNNNAVVTVLAMALSLSVAIVINKTIGIAKKKRMDKEINER